MAWNRPTSVTGKKIEPSGINQSILKGAGALITLLVTGGAVWWIVVDDGKAATEAAVAERRALPSLTHPAAKKVADEVPVTDAKPASEPKPHPALKTYRDKRGILRYEGGLRVPGQRPLAEPIQLGSHQPPRFRHDAEEHISWLLEMKIGEPVVGDYRYGDQFRRSFVESLSEPVEILDTDDEYTRQLKADVEATKKELKVRMDAGEDVAAIMNETMDEYRRLGTYKHDLQVMLAEIGNDPEKYTPQDVEDFVKAANEMLKKNGLPPIKMPRTIMRGLRK